MNWIYTPRLEHAALERMNMRTVGHCRRRRDAAELRSRKDSNGSYRYFQCHHRHASSFSTIAITGCGLVVDRSIGQFPRWLFPLNRSSMSIVLSVDQTGCDSARRQPLVAPRESHRLKMTTMCALENSRIDRAKVSRSVLKKWLSWCPTRTPFPI
jgi:hypothetical protein